MTTALIGGAIIGIAVSLMLVFNGRVTGISGIISGVLSPKKYDTSWRILFLLGLLSGGIVLRFIEPQAFQNESHNMSIYDYAFAGILVGFGTLLGNGCTSGHGVCGISRFSVRSILATIVFISFGILSVLIFKALRGGI
jgi:uncharacterized membrane protein YedE/YeeE